MDLQNHQSSSSEDQWVNENDLNHNQIKPYSLFNKIVIKYDDIIIQNFIEKQCQTPILNSNLFPFQDQNEQYQQQQQTQQEKTRSSSFKYNKNNKRQKMKSDINQNKQMMVNQSLFRFRQQKTEIQEEQTTNRIPCQDQINENQPKIKPKGNIIQTNQQALFDPIEDDQNQNWIRKKLDMNNFDTFKQTNQRPLTCPQCFTQVCYSYKQIYTKKQPNNSNGTLSMFNNGQKMFACKKLQNIIVNQHKIIRNKFSQENMKQNFFVSQINQNLQTYGFNSLQSKIKQPQIKNNKTIKNRQKQLKSYQQNLKARLQDINIKILVSCQQCRLQLGFWDVNQQAYVLLNVI